MPDSRIPLYLITGFLDSGKTTLLTDTLGMDYFNDGERTVLLMCEDGEEEYDQRSCPSRTAGSCPSSPRTRSPPPFWRRWTAAISPSGC